MLLTRIEIRNFRGIKKLDLDLDLDQNTVFLGENNTCKTAILHAVEYCLNRVKSKKNLVFDDYDFHLENQEGEPSTASPISISLIYIEPSVDAWSKEVARAIADYVSFHVDGRRQVQLRVTSQFDSIGKAFSQAWEFLDTSGNPMLGKASQPFALASLQNLTPVFYLSALRDAGKQFSRNSAFWGPFLRKGEFDPEIKKEIESTLAELNEKVVGAHGSFEHVVDHLSKIQKLLKVGKGQAVGIEALPARVLDILSKAQVMIRAATGAQLPISRHGEGTQSIAVLLLFNAFLKARLSEDYDKNAVAIVALEEPEAHLHPCAVRTLWKTIETLEGQKIISTHSSDLVAEIPLGAIRRLYKVGDEIRVGKVDESTISKDERAKLDFHIRQSRGELFFANCWILVEGETDDIILRECARILNIDIDRCGVRIVTYRHANIDIYIKIANQLGIHWISFLDGDSVGNQDSEKCTAALEDRQKDEVIFQIPQLNIELFLCNAGFGLVYEKHLSPQTQIAVKVGKNDPDYWPQVISAIKKSISKPAVALEVMKEIEIKGQAVVPQLVSTALKAAVKWAGGMNA